MKTSKKKTTDQVPGFQKTTSKQENHKHDTDWDHSESKAHWNKKNKTYVVDQLYKINWKWPRQPNGKFERVISPEFKIILMDTIGFS